MTTQPIPERLETVAWLYTGSKLWADTLRFAIDSEMVHGKGYEAKPLVTRASAESALRAVQEERDAATDVAVTLTKQVVEARAESERLRSALDFARTALEEVADPIAVWSKNLQPGYQLDTARALDAASLPATYQAIANRALAELAARTSQGTPTP